MQVYIYIYTHTYINTYIHTQEYKLGYPVDTPIVLAYFDNNDDLVPVSAVTLQVLMMMIFSCSCLYLHVHRQPWRHSLCTCVHVCVYDCQKYTHFIFP
jgi:hypothetical protein